MSHYVAHDIYGKYGYSNDVHPEAVSNCIDCEHMYDDNSSNAFESGLNPRCNDCLEAYHRRSDLLDSLSSVFEELMVRVPLIKNLGEKDKLDKFQDVCRETWFEKDLSNLYVSMTDYFSSAKKVSAPKKIKKSDPENNIDKIKEMAKSLSSDMNHKRNAYNNEKALLEKHGDFFQYNDKNQRTTLDYFKLSEALGEGNV